MASKQKFLIIPAIDLRAGRCVRLVQGDYGQETVYAEQPAAQARLWQRDGAQFLHLVDLDGARAGHPLNLAVVKAICAAVEIGCELGGGIRTVADAAQAFAAGVKRIILGTVACEEPALVSQLIARFGAEKIVVGIDARNGQALTGGWLRDSGLDALDLAAKFATLGVERFIYTDVATDGMLSGPNLAAIEAFAARVPEARVIASGGISSRENLSALLRLGKANLEGAIVGKALYEGKVKLMDLLDEENASTH